MIPLIPIIFSFIILISTGHSGDLSLKKSLTFYASFDNGTNADIAKGDKQLYTLINKKSKLEEKFNDDINQLSKETENLVEEIEKWQM